MRTWCAQPKLRAKSTILAGDYDGIEQKRGKGLVKTHTHSRLLYIKKVHLNYTEIKVKGKSCEAFAHNKCSRTQVRKCVRVCV